MWLYGNDRQERSDQPVTYCHGLMQKHILKFIKIHERVKIDFIGSKTMLPKIVQDVFDEYDKKHAQNMQQLATLEQINQYQRRRPQPQQDWLLDLLSKEAEFEHQQSSRFIRNTRYHVMAITVIIGILQAVYFTYLLT